MGSSRDVEAHLAAPAGREEVMRHQIQVSGECEEPVGAAPQSPASGAVGSDNSAARALGVVRITMLEIPWHVTPGNWRELVRLVTLESKVIERDSDETDGED